MSGTEIKDLFYGNREWLDGLDWVPVTSVDLGGGYDWDEFHAWYSPSARRYFWGSGSGCSCNSFSDDFYNVSDFEDGDRPALMAAVGRYFDGQYLNRPMERVTALSDVNGFDPRNVT